MNQKVFCSPLSSQERDWKKEYRAWIHKKRKLLPFYLSLKSLSFLFPGNWLHTLRHPQHRSKKPFFFFFLFSCWNPHKRHKIPTRFFFGLLCVVGLVFSSVGRRRRSRSNNSSRVVETHSTEQKHKSDYVHYKEQPHPPTNQKIGEDIGREIRGTRIKDMNTQGTHTHPTSTARNNANE